MGRSRGVTASAAATQRADSQGLDARAGRRGGHAIQDALGLNEARRRLGLAIASATGRAPGSGLGRSGRGRRRRGGSSGRGTSGGGGWLALDGTLEVARGDGFGEVRLLPHVEEAQHVDGLGDVLLLLGGEVQEEVAQLRGGGGASMGLVLVDGLQFARQDLADERDIGREVVIWGTSHGSADHCGLPGEPSRETMAREFVLQAGERSA
ncbi:hypothetical protein Q664_39710 [Archangium violaceum Cb vi76]|uniref:Uncharacterized protein n=1 Tax=Archangium violaceum Cb vi76 TaxID=1406225 RepID=A0A084SJT9_9BACT|nr:hypothetical protein Q664_39710 [Archangium violaceum Cb vi76]